MQSPPVISPLRELFQPMAQIALQELAAGKFWQSTGK
jgi:hypothetical protein